MKDSLKWVLILIVTGSVIFMLSPGFSKLLGSIESGSIYGIRIQAMYLIGTIAITAMSFAVILSARIGFINKLMGGLDKAYRVHKAAAVTAMIFGVIHFIVPKIMSQLAEMKIIEGPAKSTNHLTGVVLKIYDASNAFVEQAFIVLMIVVLIALIKYFSYSIFRISHKLIALLYLFIAFHAFGVPFRGGWQGGFAGTLLDIIVFIGVIGALISLFQSSGALNRRNGVISDIKIHNSEKIVEITVKLEDSFNYQAGQFAFLKFAHSSEPHPFSIASYKDNLSEIKFYIKEAGDFTCELKDKIHVGDKIRVEGPYGEFTFQKGNSQLWIAGGIGITPFLAALEYYSKNKTDKNIELIYSNIGESSVYPVVKNLCSLAGIKLHYIDTNKDGLLNFEKILKLSSPDNLNSIWFCGPEGFRKMVEKGMKENNISSKNIHYDIFNIR